VVTGVSASVHGKRACGRAGGYSPRLALVALTSLSVFITAGAFGMAAGHAARFRAPIVSFLLYFLFFPPFPHEVVLVQAAWAWLLALLLCEVSTEQPGRRSPVAHQTGRTGTRSAAVAGSFSDPNLARSQPGGGLTLHVPV
jgi:hypothetical protein